MMGNPTRGSVAGQAITTQAETKEYDEGYERTFGKGTRERGRFVYRDGQAINVDEEWTDAPRQPLRVDVSYMDGVAATDGTDISSKRKRREYMHNNGVTDTSDYSDTWKKAEKDREAFYRAERVNPSYREAVGRAEYELSKRGRKR